MQTGEFFKSSGTPARFHHLLLFESAVLLDCCWTYVRECLDYGTLERTSTKLVRPCRYGVMSLEPKNVALIAN